MKIDFNTKSKRYLKKTQMVVHLKIHADEKWRLCQFSELQTPRTNQQLADRYHFFPVRQIDIFLKKKIAEKKENPLQYVEKHWTALPFPVNTQSILKFCVR
jgi:hypothetical protein